MTISEAIEQDISPTIQCGSTKGFLNGNKLWEEENEIIKSNSDFGFALAKLRCWEKDAPRLHTNLNLHQWLVDLNDINTVEAADAYWGVARGVEILDKNLPRENTKTPNYFKKEHKTLFKSEIDRVCKEGYICTYDDLVKIWPDLPLVPQDVLGCGFIVKKKVIISNPPSQHNVFYKINPLRMFNFLGRRNSQIETYCGLLKTIISWSKCSCKRVWNFT